MDDIKINKYCGDVIIDNEFVVPIYCRICRHIISPESIVNQMQEDLICVCDDCRTFIEQIAIEAIIEDYQKRGRIKRIIRKNGT